MDAINTDIIYLADNIRRFRLLAELTTEELAQKLQVSASTVNLWENKKSEPRIRNLHSIAEALEVTTSDLLFAVPPASTIDISTLSTSQKRAIYAILNRSQAKKLVTANNDK
jgi:transcriptional regulator with XRE-family HTH domain